MNFRLTITPGMVQSCSRISLMLGRYEGLLSPLPQPKLRRSSRIRTIQGSLAIEGNTLNLEQVTAVFDEKRVLGPAKDILEVRNAIQAYQGVTRYQPFSTKSFLEAHRTLMQGLIEKPGHWRSGQVGIFKESKVTHVAPPAARVPGLMTELFKTLKESREHHPLILAAWAHYEIEFIHPFVDGNGRMGRLWQAVHLVRHHPLFEFLPVESIVRARQQEYYAALERSDREGNASHFVEFSLGTIETALDEWMQSLRPEPVTPDSRLERAKTHFGTREFGRIDYLTFFKSLSTATASRDLKLGVESGVLKRTGEKALARYRFQKKSRS